jgi:hypothetical protein
MADPSHMDRTLGLRILGGAIILGAIVLALMVPEPRCEMAGGFGPNSPPDRSKECTQAFDAASARAWTIGIVGSLVGLGLIVVSLPRRKDTAERSASELSTKPLSRAEASRS